tara:strand:- start:758 stop:1681 length:924 start_codon:yes stop_codon:yes gene_type:complete
LKNLVTGGAGFVGSHLIDRLMRDKEHVICIDNFVTGTKKNINYWINNSNFELINHDIVNPIELDVDKIWHLACPASPIHYQINPIKTAKTSFLGTYNMLGMAKKCKAKFLLASTSEVYGDPEIHPQSEQYNGNVNPTGIRSCYDEGKRFAESLTSDYMRNHGTDIRIARIFNTYGPRMLANDGRVISNFICQALNNKPLTIYGKGLQTRSFCYIDDLVEGLIKLMNASYKYPVNLGNPEEFSIIDLARIIRDKINKNVQIILKELPPDDPKQRNPNINLAREKLQWEPFIKLDNGLDKTIEYFKNNF